MACQLLALDFPVKHRGRNTTKGRRERGQGRDNDETREGGEQRKRTHRGEGSQN